MNNKKCLILLVLEPALKLYTLVWIIKVLFI